MSWLCLSMIESFSAWLQKPSIYSSENPMISLGRDASCGDTYIVLLPVLREWKILTIPLCLVYCINSIHEIIEFNSLSHWQLPPAMLMGLSWWLRQWRMCLQCGRPSFNPWVGKIPWRREWLPTLVFLPGEFLGQRSLAGYSSWGHKESDTTEPLSFSCTWISQVQASP